MCIRDRLPADHPANAYAYQEDGDDYLHLDMIHLDRETFILPTMAQSMRKTAERIFEQNHIRPRRILEVAHFDIIISMVELDVYKRQAICICILFPSMRVNSSMAEPLR